MVDIGTLSRAAVEHSALGIEMLAVAIITAAVAFGTMRFLYHVSIRQHDAYAAYRRQLTKALLLGLEFLVAADIVRTVALDATLTDLGVLGALVVVRTFLSWSLVVEVEGRWPWQGAAARAESIGVDAPRAVKGDA